MERESDVLVIGAGAAGCACALQAADAGLTVTVLSHLPLPEEGSNTSWAQGGIAYRGIQDSPQLFAQDIQQAGGMICRDSAVELLTRRGPEILEQLLLKRCQVPFKRTEDGALDRTQEAAHSGARILHVGDATGRSIAHHLLRELQAHPRIQMLYNATAIDLIMRGHHTHDPKDLYQRSRCLGAYALIREEVHSFVARETVLATGGFGQIYLHTTNPPKARGDGIAMAYRVGARMVNLEYVQFHPTALFHRHAPRFLITEAMRGEGGRLLDAQGRSFMEQYDARLELAPRDIVARALHEEMMQSNEPSMFLDISHKPKEWVKGRFPTIYETLLKYHIDITQQPIPVVPAAHYACGGIAVGLRGETQVMGLRAVGEVSCTGIHGANRLASTSLLEAITWGVQAAEGIAAEREEHPLPRLNDVKIWELEREETDPALIQQDWLTIQYTMWNYVGLVRSTRRLNRALKILRELQFEVEQFYRRAFPSDAIIGLRNGLQTALAVTHAAFRNRESRGGHYRID